MGGLGGGIGGGPSSPLAALAGGPQFEFGGGEGNAGVGFVKGGGGAPIPTSAVEKSVERGPAGEVGASSATASTTREGRSSREPSSPPPALPPAVVGTGGQTPQRPPQMAMASGGTGGAAAAEPPSGAVAAGKALGGAQGLVGGAGGGAAVALMKAVGGALVGKALGGGVLDTPAMKAAQGDLPTSLKGESTSALALRQESGEAPTPRALAGGREFVRAKPPVNSPDPLAAAPGALPIGMPVLSAAGPLRTGPVQTITLPDFVAPPDLTAGLVLQSELASRRLVLPKAPPLSGNFDLGGSDFGPSAGRFAEDGIVFGDGHYEDPIHALPLTPPAVLLLDSPSPVGREDRNGPEQTRQSYHPSGAVASYLSTEADMPRLPFMEEVRGTGERFALSPMPAARTSVRGGAASGSFDMAPGGMSSETRVEGVAGGMFTAGQASAFGGAPSVGPMIYGKAYTATPPVGLPGMEGAQSFGGGGLGPIERAARAEMDARDARLRNYDEKEKAAKYKETREKYDESRSERSAAESDLRQLPADASKEKLETAEKKAADAREKENQAKEEHQAARRDLGLEGEIPTQDERKEEERHVQERLADADAEEDRADRESSDANREAYDSISGSASDVDEQLGRAIGRLKEQREKQEQKAERKFANPKSVLDAREGKERARGIRDDSNRREARLTQIRGKGDEKANSEARAASEAAKKAAREAERAERERERVGKSGTAEQAEAADQRAKDAQEKARQKEREAREKMARAETAVRQKARAREEEARNRGDSKYAAAKAQERRARAEVEAYRGKANKYGKEESRHEKRKASLEAKAKEIRDKGRDKNGEVSDAAERRASEYDKSAAREGAKERTAERRRKAEEAKAGRAEKRAERHAKARERRERERKQEQKNSKYKEVHKLQRDADSKRDQADKYRDKATDYETKAREAEDSGRDSVAKYYDKLADEAEKKAKDLEDSAAQDEEAAKKKEEEIKQEDPPKEGEGADKKEEKKEEEKKDDTVVPEGTWPNCGPKPYCVDFRCGCPPECECVDCWWEAGEPAQKGKGAGQVTPPDTGALAGPRSLEEAWDLSERVRQEKEARGEPLTAPRDSFTKEEADRLMAEHEREQEDRRQKKVEEAWELSEKVRKEKEARGESLTAPRDSVTKEEADRLMVEHELEQERRRRKKVEEAWELSEKMRKEKQARGEPLTAGRDTVTKEEAEAIDRAHAVEVAWQRHLKKLGRKIESSFTEPDRQATQEEAYGREEDRWDGPPASMPIDEESSRLIEALNAVLDGDGRLDAIDALDDPSVVQKVLEILELIKKGAKVPDAIAKVMEKYYGVKAEEVEAALLRKNLNPLYREVVRNHAEYLRKAEKAIKGIRDSVKYGMLVVEGAVIINEAVQGPVDKARETIVVGAAGIEGGLAGTAAGAAYGAVILSPLGPVGMAIGALVFGFLGGIGGSKAGKAVAESFFEQGGKPRAPSSGRVEP